MSQRLYTIIYTLALIAALVELLFLYAWLNQVNGERVPGESLYHFTLLPSNGNEIGSDSSSAGHLTADSSETDQNPVIGFAVATTTDTSRGEAVESTGHAKEETTPEDSITNQTPKKPVKVDTPSQIPSVPKHTAQEKPTTPSKSADQLAYEHAAKTAIYPEVPRPKPVGGEPVLYPKLRYICSCESSYSGTWNDSPRQYENGKVLMNYGGNDDIGRCQINITQFGKKASLLGYDISTTAGNTKFANWLFEQEGSAPWYKSRACWRNAPIR